MSPHPASVPGGSRPRLGCLGVGWIGLSRLQAALETGCADVVAVLEPQPENAARALDAAPGAAIVANLPELLEHGLDGLLIATPSALHAGQAISALERGVAVFCQKPLGRTAAETRRVVEAAAAADVLLGVDFSYRHTAALSAVRAEVLRGALGEVHAAQLVFHNAYGPDKPWFRQPELSGGGCVIDLGIHLVDAALWVLDSAVTQITSRLFAAGRPLEVPEETVEDFAVASLDFASGATAQLACSWNLHGGCDAVIEFTFHGREAGATVRNVGGSFYDFTAELLRGTSREVLVSPPDPWGGRAAAEWTRQLAAGRRFDPAAFQLVEVASVVDGIYGRH